MNKFKVMLIAILIFGPMGVHAQNSYTTTLSLESPSTDGITTVVFDWSTSAVSGIINANALVDYSVSLYVGSSLIYSNDVLISGVLQPLDSIARDFPFWEYDLDTLTLRQFNLGVLDILFSGTVSGTHYSVEDGESLPADSQIIIFKFIDGSFAGRDEAIVSNQLTTPGPVTPPPAQAQYDYQTIDHPGAPGTQVFGINDRGAVVGNGILNVGRLPFVYASKKDTFSDVAPVAGFDRTNVLGISDAGVLAGSVINFGPNPSLDEVSGLIIDQDWVSTVFDHPDAFSFTQARGVNNKGLVTGFRDSPDDFFAHAFIYDPKRGTFTDIVPSRFTIAQGINSWGNVVGSAIFLNADDPCPPSLGFTVRYGWLRTADGTVTYFDVNGDRTSGRGINDSGTIAGFVSDTGTGKIKGFVVELDGSQCQSVTVAAGDLLAFPEADATFLGGIKNSGAVVGSYNDSTNIHGFIATPQ